MKFSRALIGWFYRRAQLRGRAHNGIFIRKLQAYFSAFNTFIRSILEAKWEIVSETRGSIAIWELTNRSASKRLSPAAIFVMKSEFSFGGVWPLNISCGYTFLSGAFENIQEYSKNPLEQNLTSVFFLQAEFYWKHILQANKNSFQSTKSKTEKLTAKCSLISRLKKHFTLRKFKQLKEAKCFPVSYLICLYVQAIYIYIYTGSLSVFDAIAKSLYTCTLR